jgi:flagellar basal-body rod protein FlgC
MSDFKIFDIAGTGMQAQNIRMNLIASNMANIDAVSTTEAEAYRAQKPVFKTVMESMTGETNPNMTGASVKVEKIVESQAQVMKEYAPNHPMANEEGYIFKSNVNPIEEMADMIEASRAFQNNIEVINSSKKMMTAVINLGK